MPAGRSMIGWICALSFILAIGDCWADSSDSFTRSASQHESTFYQGSTPQAALKKITLPAGFTASLVAGEPDVCNPIAFAIDDRGRLWVAEGLTYPVRAHGANGSDRILVFEDTHGTGNFDKRTVFMEGLNLVSGLEVGFGGVWVGAAPYLMFIPVRDGREPKPAGPAQILLDGFGYEDTHHVLNTFTWGPDGWLYGCEGAWVKSKIGAPGQPDAARIPMNGGVWRYHPTRRIFESFAEGTSNPWGIDFDEHGQLFAEVCVIPHLFHMVQGGRFTRVSGAHFNPHVYDDIKTVADHLHWNGDVNNTSWSPWHTGKADEFGGGHAHSGLMIYQGGTWPEEYRGKIFMNNILGSCINMDVPERTGSGFVAHHGSNFMNFNDPWSLVLNLKSGPDGSVYMIDWYDQNRCYDTNAGATDRSNGRIYKISYGNVPPPKMDLATKSTLGLMEMLESKNIWWSRHAQRLLQKQGRGSDLAPGLRSIFVRKILDDSVDSLARLHYLWAFTVMDNSNKADDELKLLRALSPLASGEYLRAWLVQALCEGAHPDGAALDAMAQLARDDKSPVVRLYLASALQRLPMADRWDILAGLYGHAEDAQDHNLPLMLWYAAEPLAVNNPERALALAETARLPRILEFTARRIADIGRPSAFSVIVKSLSVLEDGELKLAILRGLNDWLKGQRTMPMPEGWQEVETKLRASANPEIVDRVQSVSIVFGSQKAVEVVRSRMLDQSASETNRCAALAALLDVRVPGLATNLQEVIGETGPNLNSLREQALRGLAVYEDSQTAPGIIAVYPTLNTVQKRAALHTLTARVSFAEALMAALSKGDIPRGDVTGDLIQELRNLKNPALNQLTEKTWGRVHEANADKRDLIDKYKKLCAPESLMQADPFDGRASFTRLCAQCHTLFDAGGKVGPNLTGSDRRNLGFLIESIVDPSAIIPNDYRAWQLETSDGRTLTGLMKAQDEKSVTITTPGETMIVPRKEITSMKESGVSLMPEGLLETLSDERVQGLIRYLQRPRQLPFPYGWKTN